MDIFLFLIFMLPGTVILGIDDVLVRKLLRGGEINERAFMGVVFAGAGIMLLIPLFIAGIPKLRPEFFPAFAITVIFNFFSQWVWYKAFRYGEASLISPLRLLTPPLVLITGFFVLEEVPSFLGIIGVSLTAVGLWALLRFEKKYEHRDIMSLLKDRGVLLAILGSIAFALSFPFDKKAIISSSAPFFSSLALILLGFSSLLFVFFRTGAKNGAFSFVSRERKTLALLIVVGASGSLLTAQALNFAFAAYASSVKRLWSFWTVLFSGKFLAEKNIGKKLFATAIMFCGLLLVIFFG